MQISKNKIIESLFRVASAVLLALAGYFFWENDYERAFVIAAVGSISFFIGTRFQVKERLQIRSKERAASISEGAGDDALEPFAFESDLSETENKR